MSTPTDKKEKELKLIKTLWGIDDPISAKLFQSIKSEGYHGVEVIRLAWTLNRQELITSLNASQLAVVCQIHTSGGYLDKTGEYIYCGSYDVESHKADFKKQLRECQDLINELSHTKQSFVNVHAGVDAWSLQEAEDFLSFCLEEIEKLVTSPKSDVNNTPMARKVPMVCFETHRQRLFGSPFQLRDILQRMPSTPKLYLNADLSHWYCACERIFNPEKEARDQWWPEILNILSKRCVYIHARFGWAQGPQLSDPSAKECTLDRELQLSVWKVLMENMSSADGIGNYCFVSPEYGPAPYMVTLPHTQTPVASLPNAVTFTKKCVEQLFEQMKILYLCCFVVDKRMAAEFEY
eukprot:Awhi_evm2s4466